MFAIIFYKLSLFSKYFAIIKGLKSQSEFAVGFIRHENVENVLK